MGQHTLSRDAVASDVVEDNFIAHQSLKHSSPFLELRASSRAFVFRIALFTLPLTVLG